MKKKVLALLAALSLAGCVTGCSSYSRAVKSFNSDIDGGLNRTVTVYDYSGNQLAQYHGKFDVQASENRVFFDDEDGRRVIIYNAIVINEED